MKKIIVSICLMSYIGLLAADDIGSKDENSIRNDIDIIAASLNSVARAIDTLTVGVEKIIITQNSMKEQILILKKQQVILEKKYELRSKKKFTHYKETKIKNKVKKEKVIKPESTVVIENVEKGTLKKNKKKTIRY